jgi:hypothetical protein
MREREREREREKDKMKNQCFKNWKGEKGHEDSKREHEATEATLVHNLASPEMGALATRYYFEIMSKSDVCMYVCMYPFKTRHGILNGI